jgi:amino acid transporter
MYAFARDGGIPAHKFFHKVDPKTKSPIRTVWLACTLSFILGLPSLGSSVAFSAATRYGMKYLSQSSILTPGYTALQQ